MQEGKKIKIPSLDEIIKANPLSKNDENDDLEYPNEDEEEEMDTMFPMSEAESKYYDEEGNYLGYSVD